VLECGHFSDKGEPVLRAKQQKEQNRSQFFYGYFIVGLAFMIMFVLWGAFYAFGIFFKPILKEFGWTRAMTAGAFSLCSIVQGLVAIALGGLTDKFGTRLVMTLCGLLLGLGYVLMSQLSAVWQLYLFYGVIVGAGMGGSFTPLMSAVARWFMKRRSTMTGIVAAGTGFGALIAPPVVSRLVSSYGWRVSYVILGGIVLGVVVLCAQFMKHNPARMGLAAYGDDGESEKGLEQDFGELSLKEAVYTVQFWIVFGMIFSLGFCVFAIMVHIAPHAAETGISTTGAANILATLGGASILGKVLLGKTADRIGNRKTFIIGFILMFAALFMVLPTEGEWMLYLFAVVYGFGFGGCIASESPIVAELFGLSSHGLILGVVSFSFLLGGALGPFLFGFIFDMTGSYQWGFFACGLVSFIGLILTAILKRR
jgi:MFS family permease